MTRRDDGRGYSQRVEILPELHPEREGPRGREKEEGRRGTKREEEGRRGEKQIFPLLFFSLKTGRPRVCARSTLARVETRRTTPGVSFADDDAIARSIAIIGVAIGSVETRVVAIVGV